MRHEPKTGRDLQEVTLGAAFFRWPNSLEAHRNLEANVPYYGPQLRETAALFQETEDRIGIND